MGLGSHPWRFLGNFWEQTWETFLGFQGSVGRLGSHPWRFWEFFGNKFGKHFWENLFFF